ncbi:MAG: hypothetical protein ACYC53_08175 [Bacillota bacterium]
MDERSITVAVIGPADLVAEVAHLGRGFSGLKVWGLPYERADQAAQLYARAIGGTRAGSATVSAGGSAAGSAPSPGAADAVLFTGPIGYLRATQGRSDLAVPTAYVPYSPMWLYAPLFSVADRESLRRVSLDSLDRGVLEATYRELDLNLDAVEAFPSRDGGPSMNDPSPDEAAAFHHRAIAAGRATHALTCILEVYRRLRAEGVPCCWLVPSQVALREALEKLFYVAEAARARGAQIVVGLVRLRSNGHAGGDGRGEDDASPISAARLRLKAHERLLSQVEEFDGQLVDLGSGEFQFFTTRARFEQATDVYRHWPLKDGSAEGLEMGVGVGLGATASEAGVNAKAALDEAVRGGAIRGGANACFVMLENKRLIGPLGPGVLAYRIRNTDLALLETAGELGTAVATLQRALAALGGLDREFTARDLAPRLRVGLRTAHRLLHKLHAAGLVVEVGQESAGTRGRPRRVFRLGRAGPEAAADVGEGGGRV